MELTKLIFAGIGFLLILLVCFVIFLLAVFDVKILNKLIHRYITKKYELKPVAFVLSFIVFVLTCFMVYTIFSDGLNINQDAIIAFWGLLVLSLILYNESIKKTFSYKVELALKNNKFTDFQEVLKEFIVSRSLSFQSDLEKYLQKYPEIISDIIMILKIMKDTYTNFIEYPYFLCLISEYIKDFEQAKKYYLIAIDKTERDYNLMLRKGMSIDSIKMHIASRLNILQDI